MNVDNAALRRLLDNEDALRAIMAIEGFRNLNETIEAIINKSDSLTKARKAANDQALSENEKKELTADEKEHRTKRKEVQEKLIKFATRIPVFMYLTDFRER